MLISRRAVSFFSASFAIVRSSRAIASSRFRNCTTSSASASHTSNGIASSQASISSASSRACLGPCAAITSTSCKCPRKPFSGGVRANSRAVPAVLASAHEQSVPIFQQLARGHPSGRDEYVRYPLSLRNVEDLLAERGIDISHETVRFWWNRFGPMFAAEIRKRRVAHMRGYPQWRWHLDEVLVKVNGKLHYLWRAVDHEGEVLEAVITSERNKAAALKLLKRIMKKYGAPRSIVTDGLRAYSAAMNEIGVAAERHEVGGRLNNRAENSHQPFRRRERAMQRFRSPKTLQKFSSVHAQVPNQFNQERHLVTRQVYKQRRSAALAEWRALVA